MNSVISQIRYILWEGFLVFHIMGTHIGESYSFYSLQLTTDSDCREKMSRPPEDPKTLRLDLL